MAPLVGREWRGNAPVTAWRTCTGGDAAWCARALAHPALAVRRLDAREAGRYRSQVAELERRFGIVSVPEAPLLQLATPPAQRTRAALAGMIFMPVLGFGLWLLGLLAWRGVRSLRRERPT
jgi:hypothetical protein